MFLGDGFLLKLICYLRNVPALRNVPGPRGRGHVNTATRGNGLIGKTVRVIRGPYKGNVGFIKAVKESTFKVELQSVYQTLSFNKSNVVIIDASGKAEVSQNETSSYGSKPSLSESISKTPSNTSQTPMYSSKCSRYNVSHF